jgi:arsenate reductase
MLTLYQYPKCSTCRKALKWLDEEGVSYQTRDIVEAPPSKTVLGRALKLAGVPIAKLFNTSGQSYRQGGFKDRLPTMTQEAALDALANDGKLIKRPLIVGADVALIGFNEDQYRQRLTGEAAR